jgi:hypothetical protein
LKETPPREFKASGTNRGVPVMEVVELFAPDLSNQEVMVEVVPERVKEVDREASSH